jgi:hypothetical protein
MAGRKIMLKDHEKQFSFECPKCKSKNVYFKRNKQNKSHIGAYCEDCKTRIKWLDPDEKRRLTKTKEERLPRSILKQLQGPQVSKLKLIPTYYNKYYRGFR